MKKNKDFNRAFECWIINNINEIMSICNIGAITLMINFMDEDDNSGVVKGDTMFSVVYMKPYKRLTLNYYPVSMNLFKKMDYTNLLLGLTHEVAHIFTFPLLDAAEERCITEKHINEINEEVTEDVANIIRSLIVSKNPDYFKKGRNSKKEDKKAIRNSK